MTTSFGLPWPTHLLGIDVAIGVFIALVMALARRPRALAVAGGDLSA